MQNSSFDPEVPDIEIAGYRVSPHGWQRVSGRGVTRAQVTAAIDWGRVDYVYGAMRFVVGRRESEAAERAGADTRGCEGLHVVVSSDGEIVTVFRNRTLRRRARKNFGRPRSGRSSRRSTQETH